MGRLYSPVLVLFLMLFCVFSVPTHAESPKPSKMAFWNAPRKGANIFNWHVLRADIRAAKKYGIAFIRLALDKFPSRSRDFLLGSADGYIAMVPEDLAHLKHVLDMCAEEGMLVVLTLLSLPGSRWKQRNNDKDDLRIWKDPKILVQAVKFWQDLATALRDHPAMVRYNILNEPHLERWYC